MDNTRLNEILEEALREFIVNPLPSSLANSTTMPASTGMATPFHFYTDISLNESLPTQPARNDVSSDGAAATPAVSSHTRHIPTDAELLQRTRFFELMDDFCTRWSRYTHDYHENIRMYNQNVAQMSRIQQAVLRAIHLLQQTRHEPSVIRVSQPEPQIPTAGNHLTSLVNFPIHVRDFFMRNNGMNTGGMDLQGFSIPLQTAAAVAAASAATESASRFPTIMQVLNATERFTFTSETTRRINDIRCPISLEEYVLGEELCEIRHCRHVFKWSSLQNWFSRNSHCPVCRYDIRTFPTEVTDNTDDPL